MYTIVYLTFTIALNADQSLLVFRALKQLARSEAASLRPSILPRTDGQGFIIVLRAYGGAVDENLIARQLAGPLGYTSDFIKSRIDVVSMGNLALARRWVNNHSELFIGLPVWRYPAPDPAPFVEPDPEDVIVSQPLQWTIIEEEPQ